MPIAIRDFTDEEIEVVEAAGTVASLAAALPVLHADDLDELCFHVHAIQNMIYARPTYQSYKPHWAADPEGTPYFSEEKD